MPCTSSTMYAWNMEARSRFEVTPPTPTHTCAGICHPVPQLEGAARTNSLVCALVWIDQFTVHNDFLDVFARTLLRLGVPQTTKATYHTRTYAW